jgi:DNA invertase Pin-like site-specific DNA recombinase
MLLVDERTPDPGAARVTTTRRAFSYARFSSPEQADGRSLKRQEEAAKAYCERHGLQLDERSFTDLGVSGYKGANAKGGELGVFLQMVKDGRVPRRSVLIVENVDRLSRLPPLEANEIIKAIVTAGVDIATTSPEYLYTAANLRQTGSWLLLTVAQSLSAEESRKKGERCADAWAALRAAAREKKLTSRGPSWLKLRGDRRGWDEVPERAAWVRRVFELALQGVGVGRIAGVMNEEATEGLTGRGWRPPTVAALLRSRAVIGEYQPHTGTCAKRGGTKATRKPHGEPIQNYYPALVSEADFHRVQKSLGERRRGGGTTRGVPNLFDGLLFDALGGCPMVRNKSHGRYVLASSAAMCGRPGSAFRSVVYDFFERAVLSRLKELKTEDVLGKKPGAAADRVATLSGQLTALNQKIARTEAKAAEEDDEEPYLNVLAALHRQKKALAQELEKATAEAACREGDNLGECQLLIRLLDDAALEERDGLRARVRAALRRVVSHMGLVVADRGGGRLLYLQIWFVGGHGREYLLYYAGRRKGRPVARHCGADWPERDVDAAGCDLRRPEDAAAVYNFLHSDARFTPLLKEMKAKATPEGGKPDKKVLREALWA